MSVITAVTDDVRSDLARYTGKAGKDKIVVVHNPAPENDETAGNASASVHPWFGDGGGPVILAIGRLVEQKGYKTLLMSLAESTRKDVRLLVLGEGPQKTELRTMKVLIANYRYFVSSGPERYLFNITRHLEERGHHVMPFSITYAKNVESPYAKYFVPPLAGEDEVYFDQQSKTPKTIARTLSRLFYSPEVERAVGRMIDETRPDIAYVLYYLRKMSPSLLVGIKKRSIPLVVRISDYGAFCPELHCLRNEEPCTLCQHAFAYESCCKAKTQSYRRGHHHYLGTGNGVVLRRDSRADNARVGSRKGLLLDRLHEAI